MRRFHPASHTSQKVLHTLCIPATETIHHPAASRTSADHRLACTRETTKGRTPRGPARDTGGNAGQTLKRNFQRGPYCPVIPRVLPPLRWPSHHRITTVRRTTTQAAA